MNVDKIIELKKNKKYEEAFSLSLVYLQQLGIKVESKNVFLNVLKLDRSYFNMKRMKYALLKKQHLTKLEDEVADLILETIPLAIVFDEIVLANLFTELIKITLKRGKNYLTPISLIGCAYLKLLYYDDFASTLKYVKMAEKLVSKKDVKVNILVTYFLAANFSHMRDDSTDIKKMLLHNIKRCKDTALNELMSVEMAKSIVITGGKLSEIPGIEISDDIGAQGELLEVYKTYALALLGDYDDEITGDFLTKKIFKSELNLYTARLLSYMYFVHIGDAENVAKYSALIKKNIPRFLGYSITYQYFVYKGYWDFVNIKGSITYKDYFKFDYVIKHLEFYKLIANNELGNIYMFFSALKSISIGNKARGNKNLKRSIRRIKRQNNIRDYAMFSYLLAIYKQSRNFKRAATYNFAEVEQAYINYGANNLLKKMAIEIEKRSGTYNSGDLSVENLDIMKEFDEFIASGEDLDKSIIRVIYDNYKFENIVIFNRTPKGIVDNYSTNIEYRDDLAKKSVKYVFKTGKKLIVTGNKGLRIRNVDSYLMDNPDSRILVLAFKNAEKVLYIESLEDIKYSSEIELENLVHKINKQINKK